MIESDNEMEDELITALEHLLEAWELGYTVQEDESVHRLARLTLHKAKEHQNNRVDITNEQVRKLIELFVEESCEVILNCKSEEDVDDPFYIGWSTGIMDAVHVIKEHFGVTTQD